MPAANCYLFGEFRLDARSRVLFRSAEMVALYPKAIDVLRFLVESHGNAATKEQLLARVWPDTFFEESTLTRSISVLRKALGDTPEGHAFILTVPKRGYRFVAVVREEPADSASSSPSQTASSCECAQPANIPVEVRDWRSRFIIGGVLIVLVGSAGFSFWTRYRDKPAVSPRIMVAVLPMQNLPGDPDREFVSDGLTEDIIAQLGRINPERLGVIARTSVMTYKHSAKTVSQIGAEIRVEYVVESSLIAS